MTLSRRDEDPDLEECLAATCAHLPQLRSNWDAISEAIQAYANASISSIRPVSKRVVRVETVTGLSFAVKFGNPSAPLAREVSTLRFLKGAKCPVPAVIPTSVTVGEPEWIATEWGGNRTLDEFLDQCTETQADLAGLQLASAVAQIEGAFAQVTRQRVPDAARQMAIKLLEPWADHAADGLAWLFASEATDQLRMAVDRVVKTALSASLTAGPLDYHASNVVVSNSDFRLSVVDLGAIGYDWPGRRLAQYAMSVQSGVPGGRFRTALTPASVTQFSEALAQIHTGDLGSHVNELDAHALLIGAIAATQLRAVSTGAASA
ncbi:MAG: hypothetical protein EBU21_17140, partial [Proteobacteria bacterium]|nr:hypothetical protein [Pseudomonadota bacterium]